MHRHEHRHDHHPADCHGVRFRRSPFQRGWFHGGPASPWMSPGPRARRGDIRTAVLMLLGETPMHGYQLIQELESRSGGAWRPSPGSIYPTLELLEDQGLVRREEVEGKKIYSLTDTGREQASAGRPEAPPWASMAPGEGDPPMKLRDAFFQLGAASWQVAQTGNETQAAKALEVLTEARRRLYTILAEE